MNKFKEFWKQQMERYKQNLQVIGDKVYSYGTHVATIKGDKLIVHGWWSPTTSKHINYIAQQLGLTIVKEEVKKAGEYVPKRFYYGELDADTQAEVWEKLSLGFERENPDEDEDIIREKVDDMINRNNSPRTKDGWVRWAAQSV